MIESKNCGPSAASCARAIEAPETIAATIR
jgi:hypothetical protein